MKNVKEEDPLAVVLRAVKAIDAEKIQEAAVEASRVGMTLEKTLEVKGEIARSTLKIYADIANDVRNDAMSLDMAIRVARLVTNESMSIEEAKQKLKHVHRATQTVSSIANELMQMMNDAGIISPQQMQFAIITGGSTGMLPGRVLLLNNVVSEGSLEASISACLLLRQKDREQTDVVAALKRAHQKNCTLEQSMFELGTFKQPASYNMRLSDLLVMSGLLSDSDLLECRELSIAKNKSFKQIVLEQGLVNTSVLNWIVKLQNMVASGQLKPHSAARALNSTVAQGAIFDEAVYEEQKFLSTQSQSPLLLGQLLLMSGCITQANLDEVMANQTHSNIKIGKMLLSKGHINDDILVKALRTQSSWKYGYLSDQQAVGLLGKAAEGLSLEEASKEMWIYLPSHVQWSWV